MERWGKTCSAGCVRIVNLIEYIGLENALSTNETVSCLEGIIPAGIMNHLNVPRFTSY
jgi:hypothetical protein